MIRFSSPREDDPADSRQFRKKENPQIGENLGVNRGAWENRTPDILLAKQALYQLS
jgi:hypothetical protein